MFSDQGFSTNSTLEIDQTADEHTMLQHFWLCVDSSSRSSSRSRMTARGWITAGQKSWADVEELSLTFFHLMLLFRSKVIPAPRTSPLCLGCCWVLLILPCQLLRPLTITTTIVPDQSLNPTLRQSALAPLLKHTCAVLVDSEHPKNFLRNTHCHIQQHRTSKMLP